LPQNGTQLVKKTQNGITCVRHKGSDGFAIWNVIITNPV